jgi:two-component system response regulator GlrR
VRLDTFHARAAERHPALVFQVSWANGLDIIRDLSAEDVPLLAGHFLSELTSRYKKVVSGFAPEAVEQLVTAAWPGNVRQLYNVIEQSVALATTPLIPASLVQQAIRNEETELTSFEQARRKFEREYLAQLLKITDGNVTNASRMAKRNRTEFYKLLQRHQLDPRLFKPQRA